MGKLIIQYISSGKAISDMSNDELIRDMNIGKMQGYQFKYHTSKMNEIEFNGNDFNILLDMDILSWPPNVDWKNLDYPNEEVKGKVLEIIYYRDIHHKIEDEMNKIRNADFKSKYAIRSSAERILQIIQKIEKPKYLSKVDLYLEIYRDNLAHTINKEVSYLAIVKHSASQKKKDEAISDAVRHIESDILGLPFRLRDIDVN
ncbi:MAG: hypothetical protein IT271_05565 [Chitinophagales bacterium]|nr:hypothetical protein [Chitinophagales bacterium]